MKKHFLKKCVLILLLMIIVVWMMVFVSLQSMLHEEQTLDQAKHLPVTTHELTQCFPTAATNKVVVTPPATDAAVTAAGGMRELSKTCATLALPCLEEDGVKGGQNISQYYLDTMRTVQIINARLRSGYYHYQSPSPEVHAATVLPPPCERMLEALDQANVFIGHDTAPTTPQQASAWGLEMMEFMDLFEPILQQEAMDYYNDFRHPAAILMEVEQDFLHTISAKLINAPSDQFPQWQQALQRRADKYHRNLQPLIVRERLRFYEYANTSLADIFHNPLRSLGDTYCCITALRLTRDIALHPNLDTIATLQGKHNFILMAKEMDYEALSGYFKGCESGTRLLAELQAAMQLQLELRAQKKPASPYPVQYPKDDNPNATLALTWQIQNGALRVTFSSE